MTSALPADHLDQRQQIRDVLGHAVVAADGPIGIAVPSQIRGDHAVVAAERGCEAVERAGVVALAVQQDERRGLRAAPFPVGEAQALRLEVVLRGFGVRRGFGWRHRGCAGYWPWTTGSTVSASMRVCAISSSSFSAIGRITNLETPAAAYSSMRSRMALASPTAK